MEVAVDEQIDEALIETLVRAFYARVRQDALLGPVFAAHIVDWEPHLQRVMQFWSSVLLSSGRYQGNPLQRHAPLAVDARHFDRWLALFRETAEALCPPAAAQRFIARAGNIARSLEMGVASARGVLLAPGARYENAQATNSSGCGRPIA
jgi:hemoglobin